DFNGPAFVGGLLRPLHALKGALATYVTLFRLVPVERVLVVVAGLGIARWIAEVVHVEVDFNDVVAPGIRASGVFEVLIGDVDKEIETLAVPHAVPVGAKVGLVVGSCAATHGCNRIWR